ncbi:probable G-protein coupled receptor 139 [Heterodontus francisci]|uniref:probable G-protein coupled receptor 139 n=1 Tax=Heterodontus francisci TaxID=7792 RepID=UPI00355AD78D
MAKRAILAAYELVPEAYLQKFHVQIVWTDKVLKAGQAAEIVDDFKLVKKPKPFVHHPHKSEKDSKRKSERKASRREKMEQLGKPQDHLFRPEREVLRVGVRFVSRSGIFATKRVIFVQNSAKSQQADPPLYRMAQMALTEAEAKGVPESYYTENETHQMSLQASVNSNWFTDMRGCSNLLIEMHATANGPVFAIYYPILAAIGVPANLAVIVILSRGKCGLSKCITYYLMSMAVTDLLVMITVVILNRIVGIYFPLSFLSITPLCSLRSALNFAIVDSSVWFTVAFTVDRFMAICCQKLKIKYCTEKTAARVIGIVSTLSCIKNTFRYFIYEPLYIINYIPWFCSTKLIFYTSPAWAAYDWIHRILTPCLPFILILLLNALTVRHILAASRARRRLRSHSSGETQSDPEMEKRRKSIVLLFCISGSFILLYLLLLINFLYVRIAKLSYFSGSNFNGANFMLDQSGYMLQLLSSCVNPFIYAGIQRKFREELKSGVKYPLSLIAKLF